jgi:flagellar FliL protein
MFQNRLFNMALIIIIAISLLGVISFVLWQTYLSPTAQTASTEEKEIEPLSAKEMQEYSVDTGEITTNLLTNNYMIVRFTITADSSDAKAELEQRLPQVSSLMQEGKIVQVVTTKRVLS